MNQPQRLHPPPQRSPQGAAWFAGAPASKLLTAFTVLLYVFVHNKHAESGLELDSYAMSKSGNTYRYVTSKLTFATTGELVVGTALLVFLLRKYERELGTRRFIVFWLLVNCLAIGQEVMLVQMLVTRNRVLDLPQPLRWQYAGPYAVMGALFALFHVYAPRLHPRFVSLLGFQFSEKSFHYLWFLHCIGSGGWNTIIPALTGVVACVLYLNTPLQRLDFPDWLVQKIQPVWDRLGLSDAPTLPPRGVNPVAGAAAAAAALQQQRAPQPPPPPQVERPAVQEIPMPEPDPAAIEQLTSMGFARSQVMDALRQSHNNVEHAANRLLSGGSSS